MEKKIRSTIFWEIKLCNRLQVNQRFRGIYYLHLQGPLGQAKWKQVASLLQNVGCLSGEDNTLHNHCYENLKPYNCFDILPADQM
jgi:hypothetical protein